MSSQDTRKPTGGRGSTGSNCNLDDRDPRKPQLILFVLISYAHLWTLFGIGELFGIPFSYDPRELGGLLVLAGVPASLIAAIVATLVTRGRDGVRQLLKRSLEWRFSAKWYLMGLLIPVLVTVASTAAAVYIEGFEVPDGWFSSSLPLGSLVFFLIYDGLGEEIGWRGFALPQLQERLGSLGGSITVGILWACWHLPLFLMPGSSQYGSSLGPYVYLLTCWTIVMALLVHKARGSVVPAILVHEAANFVAFAVRYPRIYVHLLWGVAAVLAILFLPRPLIKLPLKSGTLGT